ncbi:MAG: hypothetical protein ABI914_03480 [Acidobacteriota bacterium]
MEDKCKHEPCTCRPTGEGAAPEFCSEPCSLLKIEFEECACEHPECRGHT